MMELIKVLNLKKDFLQGFTLGPVNFSLHAGETVAFLGANGSGKSTLFELLTGNMDASSGEILFKSERMLPEKSFLKRQLGYLPQVMHLPRWVTAVEILNYAAALYELPHARKRVQTALTYWDCASYQDKPLITCSFGMQKRVGLALATLHDPLCLVIDEPFSGLDLFHIRTLESTISQRCREGKTTLLSTHILPYVAQACHRVLLLKNGILTENQAWGNQNFDAKIKSIEDHFFP